VAVAEAYIGQRLVGLDLQDRDVGLRVAADDLRGVFAVVLQRHFDLGGLAGDVVVGDDGAGGIDDEAGAERDALGAAAAAVLIRVAAERAGDQLALAATVLALAATVLEKAAQEIVERRAAEALGRLLGHRIGTGFLGHRYVHHRR